jgi:hypothetical protein
MFSCAYFTIESGINANLELAGIADLEISSEKRIRFPNMFNIGRCILELLQNPAHTFT